jgi:hypothetical protein
MNAEGTPKDDLLDADQIAQLLDSGEVPEGGIEAANEAIQQVKQELAKAFGGGFYDVTIPATFFFRPEVEARYFECADPRSWGWAEAGVFGLGKWSDSEPDAEPEYNLFPLSTIARIQLDFDALEKLGRETEQARRDALKPKLELPDGAVIDGTASEVKEEASGAVEATPSDSD